MDVAAGGIAWERVRKDLDRMNAEKKAVSGTKEGESPPLPVSGILRLSIGSFTFRDFVWKPVLADIELAKESVTATVRKADVCGISTTGELQFLRGGAMSAMARVASVGPDIGASLTCLGFQNAGITGRYEASLEAEGKGKAAELPRAIQGKLAFQASNGTMGKASVADEDSGGRQSDGGLRGQEPGPSRRGNDVQRIHSRRPDGKRPGFRFARRH